MLIQAPVFHDRKFDRLKSIDVRDLDYPMRAAIDMAAPLRPPWQSPPAMDQGSEGSCVGFGSTHMLAAAPWMHTFTYDFARGIYLDAKKIDEWQGEDYEGTSVRAGMKVLQARGLITEYLWTWDTDTVRDYVLRRGPVTMGTNWYARMMDTDANGYVYPDGASVGGHCWTVLGYSGGRNAFRAIQSWGSGWGQTGRFWITWEAFKYLLEEDGGEAVSPLEVARPRQAAD
jgi:hypothetical protein